jgi:hypothetical protein
MAEQLDAFKDKIKERWYEKVMRGLGVRRLPWCKCWKCASEFFDDKRVSKRKSCPFCGHKGMEK